MTAIDRSLKGKLQHARGRIGAKFLKASRKTSKCRARTTACGRKSIDVIALTAIRTEDEIMDRVVGHGMVGGGRTIAEAERGSGAAGKCGDSEGKGAEGRREDENRGRGVCTIGGQGNLEKSVKDADARGQERTSNDIIVPSEPLLPPGIEQPRLDLCFHYHHGRDGTRRYAVGLEIATKWMLCEQNVLVRYKSFTEDLIKQAVLRTANACPLATPACDDRHGDSRFVIDVVYARANFCLCTVDGNKIVLFFSLTSFRPSFSALCGSEPSSAGTSFRFAQHVAEEDSVVWNGEEVDRRGRRRRGGDGADSNGRSAARMEGSTKPNGVAARIEGISLKTCNDEGGRRTREGKSGTSNEALKRVVREEARSLATDKSPTQRARTNRYIGSHYCSSRTCCTTTICLSSQRANDNAGLSLVHHDERASCEDGRAVTGSHVFFSGRNNGQDLVREEKCTRSGGAMADEKAVVGELLRERLEESRAQVLDLSPGKFYRIFALAHVQPRIQPVRDDAIHRPQPEETPRRFRIWRGLTIYLAAISTVSITDRKHALLDFRSLTRTRDMIANDVCEKKGTKCLKGSRKTFKCKARMTGGETGWWEVEQQAGQRAAEQSERMHSWHELGHDVGKRVKGGRRMTGDRRSGKSPVKSVSVKDSEGHGGHTWKSERARHAVATYSFGDTSPSESLSHLDRLTIM
ncbi:hypothetical protein K488DRAFT_75138, partial [Vararia minispora EC-137]